MSGVSTVVGMRVRYLICSGAAFALLLGSCADDDGGSNAVTMSSATGAPRSAVTVAAVELVTGDCVSGLVIGAAERRTIESARVVDCGAVHELEIFATFVLSPEELQATGDGTYPGEERIVRSADEGCASRLEDLGVDDELGVIAIWPTKQSWSQGDRQVTCAAFDERGKPFQERRLVAARDN